MIYRNRSRFIIFTALAVVLLLSLYLLIKKVFPPQPYPSISKQRAALVNKPSVRATRLLDSVSIIKDLEYLASDTCEGRQPGSKGHERAVERIVSRMREAGLDSFNNSLIQTFAGKFINGSLKGENIIGWIKGTKYPKRYIVISAHYDHLGKWGDKIFYGASDNASGVACLLAIAKYYKQNPLPFSLIFAAFDREESGIEGAFYFTNHLPLPLNVSEIRFNLNIDMIARNDSNEIFASGIYHNPSLIYLVKEIQNKTTAKVLAGHDIGNWKDDWTNQSDHFAFYKKNIPFLYIGVEDHPDYHKPTDTYDKFNFGTYIENCNMIAVLTKLINL